MQRAQKMRKMAIVMVTSFCMIANITPAKADIIRSVNTKSASLQLTFNNGDAVCLAYVKGIKKDTKISGKLVLSRVTTTTETVVKSWSVSSNNPSLNVNKTTAVTKGNYRLDLKVKVTCGGKSETVTKSSSAAYL